MVERVKYSLEHDGLPIAKALAEASTPDANYGHGNITPGDVEMAMTKHGPGPVWFAWSGTKEDAVYTAITGNGPTSEANAVFFAHAREIVLELVAEVARLRLLQSMAEHSSSADGEPR